MKVVAAILALACIGCSHHSSLPRYDGNEHAKPMWSVYIGWSSCEADNSKDLNCIGDIDGGVDAIRYPYSPGKQAWPTVKSPIGTTDISYWERVSAEPRWIKAVCTKRTYEAREAIFIPAGERCTVSTEISDPVQVWLP
jgi:hypothetical protein